MNPSEIEFLAETQTIRIVPNFNESVLYLFDGDFGPFKAGIPLEVPLWLAINLKQRQRCRFIQPDWMDPDKLEEVKEAEQESQFFTEMPNKDMFVVTQLIMDVAIRDLENADKIRTVLRDIWDIRQAKLMKSVDAFVQSGQSHARLDHLQLIELNSIRPLLPKTLDHILDLEKASNQTKAKMSQSQSQNRSFI